MTAVTAIALLLIVLGLLCLGFGILHDVMKDD